MFRLFKRKQQTNKPKLTIMQSAIIALLRHILTFIGGTIVAKGLISEELMLELVGGLLTLLSTGWMFLTKIKGKNEDAK